MPKDNENLNILIQIRAWDDAEQAYPVEATLSDGSHFGGGKMRLGMDRVQEVATDPEQYGLLLFDALFSGPIRRAYDIASSIARREEGKNAALHLWITEKAPELHTLAWEQMHHIRPGQTRPTPLATSAESPLSRYMKLETPSLKPIQKRPIRLLFAISNPSNISDFRLSPLDIPSEITNLLKAVSVLQDAGQLEVTLLPGHTGIPVSEKNYKIQETKSGAYVQLVDEKGQATGPRCQIEPGTTDIDTLIQSLTQGEAVHILHFLGHGSFNPRLGMAALALENKTGTTEWITEEELLAQLPDEGLPYLVFLAACESARRGTQNSNPFIGIAPRLIQAGIPVIVAMQDLVPVTTAREFTHYFYRYLLEHGLVDKAMNQARLMLFEADSAEWAIPTLFMRLEDGRLFTRDPIRSLLTMMADSDTFNPLAAGETYLPLEVLRLSGNLKAMDFYNLQQESMTTSNMMDVIWDIFSAEPDPQIYMLSTKLIALMGDSGMGKSFQLRRIGQRTIRQSLKGQDQQFVIPIYLDLEKIPLLVVEGRSDLEKLIFKELQSFWESLTKEDFKGLLTTIQYGPKLRIMIDGLQALPDHQQIQVWHTLNELTQTYPHHDYVVSYGTGYFDPVEINATEFLIIQPLSKRKIEEYLLQQRQGRELYKVLEKTQLFDLAALPWLLMKLLKQAQKGRFPQSHTQILRDLTMDAVAKIATDNGMRTQARNTLYALAWEMHSTFEHSLPINKAFSIMARERGSRGYNLETFYLELIKEELLAPIGNASVRFSRYPVWVYCSAQALRKLDNYEQVLDDIVATLGRYTRYNWWADIIVILSGLLDEPEALIERLLYGVALSEGEQVFLAARCIQECGRENIDERLVNYVISTLLWRLDSNREPRVARRVRLIESLAQLTNPAVILRLAKIASQKVRDNNTKYEDSSVRLAALNALRQIIKTPFKEIQDVDGELAQLLNYWAAGDIQTLVEYLLMQDAPDLKETGTQALAAFALGNLQSLPAVDILVQLFLYPESNQETYQNLATALTLVEPGVIMERVILPLIDEKAAQRQYIPQEVWEQRERWYPYLVYLIGKLRVQDKTTYTFLHRCLQQENKHLKGLAVQALGWLYDRDSKTLFEDMALTPPDPETGPDLQLKSLESLYYIGDYNTLTRLQRERPLDWDPELEQAAYRTMEQILTRHKKNY